MGDGLTPTYREGKHKLFCKKRKKGKKINKGYERKGRSMKMGDLRRTLRRAGWVKRPGKGSHEHWYDPTNVRRRLTLSHSNDEEAPKYILHHARKLLKKKE
jgi:predicted RNA binding protein YcfA (HicA-like mRNA interferase family)